MPQIPKNIHFIWGGGPIPERYLASIHRMAVLAKKSNFKINLWVDNKNNYLKTSAISNITIPNLKLRNIEEIFQEMELDDFFGKEKRSQKFETYVKREMIGNKNLAAAADFLRYAILYIEGGYYFDTDTDFIMDEKTKLTPDNAKHGFLFAMDPNAKMSNSISGNNNILAVVEKHPIFQKAIIKALENFDELDKITKAYQAKSYKDTIGNIEPWLIEKLPSYFNRDEKDQFSRDEKIQFDKESKESQQFFLDSVGPGIYYSLNVAPFYCWFLKLKDFFTSQEPTPFVKTFMDRKREHKIKYVQFYDCWAMLANPNRRNLTISLLGPGLLSQVVKDYVKNINNPHIGFDLEKDYNCNAGQQVYSVAGIKTITRCDNTWLPKKKSKQRAYDDSELKNFTLFEKIGLTKFIDILKRTSKEKLLSTALKYKNEIETFKELLQVLSILQEKDRGTFLVSLERNLVTNLKELKEILKILPSPDSLCIATMNFHVIKTKEEIDDLLKLMKNTDAGVKKFFIQHLELSLKNADQKSSRAFKC